MSDHLKWQLLTIGCATLASLLVPLIFLMFKPRKKCPECGTTLSNFKMAWEDKNVVRHCPKCHCALDYKGNKIKPRKKGEDDEDEPARGKQKQTGVSPAVIYTLVGCGMAGVFCLVGIFGITIVMILVDGPGDRGGPPPKIENIVAEDLGPKEALTNILGAANNPTFKEQAPDGGLLIGFDVGLGQAFGVELVKAIQPRFRSAQGETAGRKFGTDFAKVVSVKAKPGYAVGAIDVKSGLVVNGFSVKFMRVKGAALDPKDFYVSEWIGDKTGGGGPTLLGGDGKCIIGIIGRRDATDCTGIGLLKRF